MKDQMGPNQASIVVVPTLASFLCVSKSNINKNDMQEGTVS
jgi:hypothetical protein